MVNFRNIRQFNSLEEFEKALRQSSADGGFLSVLIKPEELKGTAEILKAAGWRFSLLTVWDIQSRRRSEYIFRSNQNGMSAFVQIEHDINERVRSLSGLFPYCGLQEKEQAELFGVMYEGLEYLSTVCLAKEYKGKPSPMNRKN